MRAPCPEGAGGGPRFLFGRLGRAVAGAARTAAASRLAVETTRADLAAAETDVAMADVGEAEAKLEYQAASDRAGERTAT